MLNLLCTTERVTKCLLELLMGRWSRSPFWRLAKFCRSLMNVNHMLCKDFVLAHLDPRSKVICSWGDNILVTAQDFIIGERQYKTLNKGTELSWMNEVAFRPWLQRRQWCLNSFRKISLILRLRGLPRSRSELLRSPGSHRDVFTVICVVEQRDLGSV